MLLQLDDYDVSILKSLLKDGRKSFREVSRETGITTPTVKARFTRLVNVGFIKSVSPILDSNIIENEDILKPELENERDKGNRDSKSTENEGMNNNKLEPHQELQRQQDNRFKIKKGLNASSPLNVFGGVPTIALDYSPLWDVNLGEWTKQAIDNSYRSRLTEEFQILGFVDQGWVTGPNGTQFGSTGSIVNCPIVFRFL